MNINIERELKRRWDTKKTVIQIVIGAPGMIPKRLMKGQEDLRIRGQVETTALSILDNILRRVLETWGDLLSLKLLCKSANVGVDNSQKE